MSTFLGIGYDLWHGIFGALIMVVSIVVCSILIGFTQAGMLLGVGVGVFVGLLLQSLNESMQAISSTLLKDYGSLKNFQANSRRDWKYWMLGTFVGALIGVLIFILIDKVF